MRRSVLFSAISLLGLAVAAVPCAHAGAEADQAALQCDTLAASTDDVTKPAGIAGKEMAAIDAAAATGFCEKALSLGLNDVRLLFNLGRAYQAGGQAEKAFQQYKLAAEAGNASAMNHLGFAYDKGFGTAANPVDAAKWYEKSAEAGVVRAQRNIAIMYMDGEGVAKDNAKALLWFGKSADAGFSPSMNYLGIMHEEGRGVPENPAEAAKWYSKAADLGDRDGLHNLGLLLEEGKGIAKDEKRAVELFTAAARAGNTHALSSLGRAYENGIGGLEADGAKAMEFYLESAKAGSPDGMHDYGEGLLLGDAAKWQEGMEWLNKALEAGSERAAFTLGVMTANGEIPDSTPAKAASLFITALEGYSTGARDALILKKGIDYKADVLDALQDALIARGGSFAKTSGKLEQGAIDYMQSILAGG